MSDITVTLTINEAQYLVNAVQTHVKTHGLEVAAMGVMVVFKLQTASNQPTEDAPSDGSTDSGDQE